MQPSGASCRALAPKATASGWARARRAGRASSRRCARRHAPAGRRSSGCAATSTCGAWTARTTPSVTPGARVRPSPPSPSSTAPRSSTPSSLAGPSVATTRLERRGSLCLLALPVRRYAFAQTGGWWRERFARAAAGAPRAHATPLFATGALNVAVHVRRGSWGRRRRRRGLRAAPHQPARRLHRRRSLLRTPERAGRLGTASVAR